MSLSSRYRDLPIRHKLKLIVMLTVGAALTVACGAVFIYHYYALRDSLRRDLSVLAEITGDNSTAGTQLWRSNDRGGATLGAESEALHRDGSALFSRW
jgi:hypothetical protein